MSFVGGQYIANRYEVVRFIASGTYGEVYEVYDHHQGMTGALKLLDPRRCGPWPWEEATRLTALRSDYILTIHNADVDAGTPFIVTDLATQGSLDVAGTTLPRLTCAAAIGAIRDAARGLARTHDGGVLHRDVKLANLFWSNSGRVVVGDYGLAHPMTPNGTAPPTGTPVTTAPEVLAGDPARAESDMWSLGACLYRLLTGTYPHMDQGLTGEIDLARIRSESDPTPVRDLAPHVGVALGTRINRSLARDPADRYSSMSDFEADLGRLARAKRAWVRDVPYSGHEVCWTAASVTSAIRVCITAGSTSARAKLEVVREPSGYRIRKLCRDDALRRVLRGALRATFEELEK